MATTNDIDKELKKFINKDEFKKAVEKIILDRIKNEKYLEDKVVDITKNVLTQLYKTFWVKKSFWQGNLSNKSN